MVVRIVSLGVGGAVGAVAVPVPVLGVVVGAVVTVPVWVGAVPGAVSLVVSKESLDREDSPVLTGG